MNAIPTVLKDGEERRVSKDELQYLLLTQQILFFKRNDGWVVCGRDREKMRMNHRRDYPGEDRRQHSIYAPGQWY